jgi:hypothetical protein
MKKIALTIFVIHLSLSFSIGALNIYAHISAAQMGIDPNSALVDSLEVLLSIFLFPIKTFFADFILSSAVRWLFIPAIIINSLIWTLVFSFGIQFLKRDTSTEMPNVR